MTSYSPPPRWSEIEPDVVVLWAPGDSPGKKVTIYAGWWRRNFRRGSGTATWREVKRRALSPVEQDRLQAVERYAMNRAWYALKVCESWDRLAEDV